MNNFKADVEKYPFQKQAIRDWMNLLAELLKHYRVPIKLSRKE